MGCADALQALPDVLLDNNHYQQQQRALDTAAAGGPLPLHYVELRAPSSIMPWTLHRLLGLLQVGCTMALVRPSAATTCSCSLLAAELQLLYDRTTLLLEVQGPPKKLLHVTSSCRILLLVVHFC